MAVLWALWGIGVLNVAAAVVSSSVHLLLSRFTTFAAPAFLSIILIMAAIVTTFAGGFAGLLLVLLTDAGPVLIVSTGVLLAGATCVTAFALNQVRLSRRDSRVGKRLLSRDEVVDLIKAGLVHSFSRRNGVLEIQLKLRAAKEPALRHRRAHPRDYLAFVAAATEGGAGRRKIRYEDDTGEGPSSTERRWITVAEAAALLGADQVKTFGWGGLESPDNARATFRGTPTGIKLIDHGWARHIVAAPESGAALLPLARVARSAHGRPHIIVDGHWEQRA
ncbi:hypothetical protein ABZ342_08620 [Amycolatopsis sp. NPDC005961]|uniref:hypothetical protein n=1 Tax=Amycolatopsis sp. NPDC005961 TaxID=3156720 RepID=UPI0033CEDAFE